MEQNESIALYQTFLREMFDIFIKPEVRRRQEEGIVTAPTNLYAAQIIFYADGRRSSVRLNEEIVAIAKMKLKEGVRKLPGDVVYENELEGLEEIGLGKDEDPDCGHVTLVRVNGQWVLSFDFVYNKGLSRRYMETSREFLESAELALGRGYKAVFLDNLFRRGELWQRLRYCACGQTAASERARAIKRSIRATIVLPIWGTT